MKSCTLHARVGSFSKNNIHVFSRFSRVFVLSSYFCCLIWCVFGLNRKIVSDVVIREHALVGLSTCFKITCTKVSRTKIAEHIFAPTRNHCFFSDFVPSITVAWESGYFHSLISEGLRICAVHLEPLHEAKLRCPGVFLGI